MLTICPTYPYKLDVLREGGIETKSDIQFGARWVPDKERGPWNGDAREFYNDVTLKVQSEVNN